MLKRFHVDNYKCLVNFEYEPTQMQLIVGANGSGKSTAFEALQKLQQLLLEERSVSEVFPPHSRTRWQSRNEITFDLEIIVEKKMYRYELTIVSGVDYSEVQSEVLWINGEKAVNSIAKMEWGDDENDDIVQFHDVSIYLKNGSESKFRVADTGKSVFSSSVQRYSSDFRDALRQIIFVKPVPSLMTSAVKDSSNRPSNSLHDFAAYYLHLLQEKQGLIFDLLPILRENIQGFHSFALEERALGYRQLGINFIVEGGKKNQTVRYNFNELSDGQRILIALYTLAFCESGSALLIDEPENFVSSRELQPWLMLLQERIEEFGGQAILISHHPEFINALAPQDAIQFRRKNGGPVTIRPFETARFEGLTPAEIVARGWDNE